jgi:hypothetical protein
VSAPNLDPPPPSSPRSGPHRALHRGRGIQGWSGRGTRSPGQEGNTRRCFTELKSHEGIGEGPAERSRCLETRPGLGRQRAERQGDRSGVRGAPAKIGTAVEGRQPRRSSLGDPAQAPRSLELGRLLGREGRARRGPPAEGRRPFASPGEARARDRSGIPGGAERRGDWNGEPDPRPSRGCAQLQKLAFYLGGSWV